MAGTERLSHVAQVQFSHEDVQQMTRAAESYRRALEMYRSGKIRSYASIRDEPATFAATMGGDPDYWRARAAASVRRGRDPFCLTALVDFVSVVAGVWNSAGGQGRGFHRAHCCKIWTGPMIRLALELLKDAGVPVAKSGMSIARALTAASTSGYEAQIDSAVDLLEEFANTDL